MESKGLVVLNTERHGGREESRSALSAHSAVKRRSRLRQQPPRQDTPDRVSQPRTIVARDVAGPELAADQLAVLRQLTGGQRFLVLLRVPREHRRRWPLHVRDDD